MEKKILSLALFAMLVLFASAGSVKNIAEFFVAKNGSSSNDGTKAHPYSSLEDAKKAIQNLKKVKRLPEGEITVWLREGIYELPASFSLSEDNSGTENGPITFSAYAYEKVVLTGGKKINVSKVKPISLESAKRVVWCCEPRPLSERLASHNSERRPNSGRKGRTRRV